MKTLIQIVGLLLLLGIASQTAVATTYKYQDASGDVVYSQNPPADPNTPYEVLGVPSHARPGTNSGADTSGAQKSITGTAEDNQANQQVADEVKKAQEIRAKNCAAAKKNLEIYTVYRRVKNEKGEMVRLNDAERQKGIDEAKKAIKEFCD
jgi:hypothetical protein